METRITATELARNLSDVLNRAKYRGEKFVVERNGEVMVSLQSAIPKPRPAEEIAAALAGLEWPDDEFANDLEAAMKEMRRQLLPEPPEWPD